MDNKRQVSYFWRKKGTDKEREKPAMKPLVLDWNLGHQYEHTVLKFIHIQMDITETYIDVYTCVSI